MRVFARLASLALVFVSVSVSAAGCGSDKYDFAGEYCAALSPCCAAAGLGTSASSCKQLLSGSVASSDEGAQHRCVDTVRAAVQSKAYCANLSEPAADAACAGLFRMGSTASSGTKAPGTACTSSSECASATDGEGHCSGVSSGICQVWKTGKDGDAPCIGTKAGSSSEWSGQTSGNVAYLCDANKGIYCDFSADVMGAGAICRAKQSPGGACATSQSCVAEAYCSSMTSTCVARLDVGAACKDDVCVSTAFCDPASSTCKPRSPDGASCTGSSECLGGDCHNGACKTSVGLGGFALAFLCGH